MIQVPIYPGLKVIGNGGANAYVYTRKGTEWTVTHIDDEEYNEVFVVATHFYDMYKKFHPNASFESIYYKIHSKERSSAFSIHIPDFKKRFDVQVFSQKELASKVLERLDV